MENLLNDQQFTFFGAPGKNKVAKGFKALKLRPFKPVQHPEHSEFMITEVSM